MYSLLLLCSQCLRAGLSRSPSVHESHLRRLSWTADLKPSDQGVSVTESDILSHLFHSCIHLSTVVKCGPGSGMLISGDLEYHSQRQDLKVSLLLRLQRLSLTTQTVLLSATFLTPVSGALP